MASEHHCHARGCAVPTKPEMLMCLRHWRMVPREVQRAVWATYRPGQCDDKQPSEEWHKAADAAIAVVAEKDHAKQAAFSAATAAFVAKLADGKVCPHCDKPIEGREQIGRCVYLKPCGHRLGQATSGPTPAEGKE